MADEDKTPPEKQPPTSEAKPEQPAASKPAVPPKPAAAAPKKPTGPQFEEISGDPLIDSLRSRFEAAIFSAKKFLGQRIVEISKDQLLNLMGFLRDDPQADFKLLSDLSAVDYPKKPKRFEVVYQLYSITRGQELRVKVALDRDEPCPSVVVLWSTANWLERECYDMFGIVFEGHPDLRRILLPDGWRGFPLRKEYEIRQQDEEWIRANLTIRKDIYP